MKRFWSLAVGVATAAVGLSACGSSATSSSASVDVLAGLNAHDVVLKAASTTTTTSLRYDVAGSLTIDTSKLTGMNASDLRGLTSIVGAGGVTIAGKGEQENGKRLSLTLTLTPAIKQAVMAVVYDGVAYYSTDGGTHFAGGKPLSSLTSSAGIGLQPDDSLKALESVAASVQDQGRTTMDGLNVDHVHVTITKDSLAALFQSMSGSSASSSASSVAGGLPGSGTGGMDIGGFGQLFTQLIDVRQGDIDAYVRTSDGRLDRLTENIVLSIDLSKLGSLFGGMSDGLGASPHATPAAGMPGGSFSFGVKADTHYYDFGAPITITKPTVDPTAPTFSTSILGGTPG